MATTNPMTGSLTACLLELTQRERVNAHQRQNRETQRHKRDVEHDRLLVGSVLSANPRKLSISNWAAARKDFVSFSGTVHCPTRLRGEECSWSFAIITNIMWCVCLIPLDTFADTNVPKDVVAGSNAPHWRMGQAWRR